MYQKHFQTISSTQTFLKENYATLTEENRSAHILISCDQQTDGIGSKNNLWDFYQKSLAISFTLIPNITPTLTPLEIGLIISKYFREKHSTAIFLKWPNDLLNHEGKKCSGIICQYIDSNLVIAGLGINLGFQQQKNTYPHGFSSLVINYASLESLSREIYKYILNNRILTFFELEMEFMQACSHINKKVKVDDAEGLFQGIGKGGEALVLINGEVKKFYSSSLTISS